MGWKAEELGMCRIKKKKTLKHSSMVRNQSCQTSLNLKYYKQFAEPLSLVINTPTP
jgi:hypothetical protein